MAATKNVEDTRDKVIMINDVSQAFFEAQMWRNHCVALPEEALGDHDHGRDLVDILKMSLYGTKGCGRELLV